MALYVHTSKPRTLLAAIRKAIDNGKVTTWSYDRDGDFIHDRPQWRGRAWLRPSVQDGMLRFGLFGQRGTPMAKAVYGVYHGRFMEMLLMHFDGMFSNIEATAVGEILVDNFQSA